MIGLVENIGITLLVSGIISFGIYFIFSHLQSKSFGLFHYIGLGILFLLLSYQSYRLMCAWDERSVIEEAIARINDWADDAIDFVDELDRQNGGNGEIGKQINDAMNNPLVQRGFDLFGIDVGMNGKMTMEMAEKLKTKYNWYMFRRICWMFGFILIYGIFVTMIPAGSTASSNRLPHSTNRSSHRPSSRYNGYHSRRR